jgi:hypothetical protein
MKQMMKSEEAAARGFKRLERLMVLGDDVGAIDGGFAKAVGPVKPLVSLQLDFFHPKILLSRSWTIL